MSTQKTVSLEYEARLRRARENLRRQVQGYERFLKEADAAEKQTSAKHQYALGKANDQIVVVTRAEEVVERLEARGDWVATRDQWIARLTEQYGQRGPQYDILIARAAEAEARAEQLAHSGRSVEVAEWRQSSRAVLDCVQALQRYTEAEKKEQIQKAEHKAIVWVLELAERVVAPEQPHLWGRVLEAVQSELPSGTEVA